VKTHTPECAKIEQFAAILVPVKSNVVCFQDFGTKDYKLEFREDSLPSRKSNSMTARGRKL
jgi:hypothetical protein